MIEGANAVEGLKSNMALNGNEKQSMIRSTSFYLSRTELMHHKPIFYNSRVYY